MDLVVWQMINLDLEIIREPIECIHFWKLLMRRVCWTNPVAIAFCCGCLPFVYLFTVAIVFAVILVPSLGFFFLSLAASPLIFYHSYRAAILTPRLGVEYKIGLVTFLIVPILVAPLLILALCPVYALVIAAVCAASSTFGDEMMVIGGLKDAFESLGEHWGKMKKEFFQEFKEKSKRIAEPTHDYNRYTLGLHWLPIAFLTGIISSLVIGTFALLSFVIKILPITLILIKHYCFYYFDECSCFRAMLFLPWLIFLLAMPVLVPIGGLFLVIASFLYGLFAFTVPFHYELKGIVWWIWRALGYIHNESNGIIYECKFLEIPEPDMDKLIKRNYKTLIKV